MRLGTRIPYPHNTLPIRFHFIHSYKKIYISLGSDNRSRQNALVFFSNCFQFKIQRYVRFDFIVEFSTPLHNVV